MFGQTSSSIPKLNESMFTGRYWVISWSFCFGLHLSLAPSLSSFPPLLPFQIIKAYLDYSLYQHLAGYQDVWFKYEVMAMKQIFNLPLKREGVEIMTYVADRLGYIKLLMGHLDLAIDLGKGWLVKKGHANTSNNQNYTGIVLFPGSRAHKMWSLLRNPNKHYLVLCWLCKCLFLKNRYLSQGTFQNERKKDIFMESPGFP